MAQFIGSLIREHNGSKIHQHVAQKFVDIRTIQAPLTSAEFSANEKGHP